MCPTLAESRGDIIPDGKKAEGSLKSRQLNGLQKIQFVFQMTDTALDPKQHIVPLDR